MAKSPLLEKLATEFSVGNLTSFLRTATGQFRPSDEDYSHYLDDKYESITELQKVGEMEYETERLIVIAAKSERELTSKSGRRKQYELAREIIKKELYDAGIFVFYDDNGKFRFSLVVAHYAGTRRNYSSPKRYSFFVSPELTNKTFFRQMGKADFSSIQALLSAFSIEAVSDDFYNEFNPKFNKICQSIAGEAREEIKKDFALIFVIRIIFLGFVQKKGWLGNNEKFIQAFWNEYSTNYKGSDTFYDEWLKPLFFEALNSPPGRKVKYQNNNFSQETEDVLQMAPYLNGELFKEKPGIDTIGLSIPDETIDEFLTFLFQYNFTIEENTLYDEELELNPEFLGIIFERLVNKEDGAVYTPRTEVDFMCRMALLKWLEKNSSCSQQDLYHFFFREGGQGDEHDEVQKQGDFSPAEIRELITLLESVTVCDPAAGSGAFEVGMLHVLEELLENLYARNNTPEDLKTHKPSQYELKNTIIATSLYGVEVKPWAVWINHLRLWLSLFIDMPDDEKTSLTPLLPNLHFKVCCGDSLVQRIGNKLFPVRGHHSDLLPHVKGKITSLKKLKNEFFHNQTHDAASIRQEELRVFHAVLDAEIESLSKHAIALSSEQTSLFEKSEKQLPLELNKKDKERIEQEIEALKEQKKNLHKEGLPFIWNIEFAEIFFDKGGFDIIIGNPPYVQQEEITDPYKQLSPSVYKETLKSVLEQDFPHVLSDRNIKVNGRSDLYTYFYVRSLHLLNPEGIHVFICSNSWLDVEFGAWLQQFLLTKVPMYMIVDNHAKRSFANAEVNTVITIFDAPQKKKTNPQHCVKFVAFKRPFVEVILSENLIKIENTHDVCNASQYRIYPINYEQLWLDGSENISENGTSASGKYIGNKWGAKYLRAPELFWRLLENEKIEHLSNHAKVETVSWSRKGNNKTIIVPKGSADRLKKIVLLVKSPKDVASINVDRNNLKYDLIVDSIRESEIKKADLLWVDLRDKKHVCHLNSDSIAYSHAFHGIRVNRQDHILKLCLILNSTLMWLITEIYGRTGLGGGATRVLVNDLKNNFPTLSPDYFPDTGNQFESFLKRDVKSIFEECGIECPSDTPIYEQEPTPLPDRAELDRIIFDILNLSDSERKNVYHTVCELVWNRISRARST